MNDKLKRYVDRYKNLLQEEAAAKADQKELAVEITDDGYDAATVKKLAQLALDGKKARKERAKNETLALYNREAGTQIDFGFETAVAEIVGEDERDERAVRAVALLREGKSIRAVARETGMGHGTVQRLRAELMKVGVPDEGTTAAGTPPACTPPHDPETGELHEPAAAGLGEPESAVVDTGQPEPAAEPVTLTPEQTQSLKRHIEAIRPKPGSSISSVSIHVSGHGGFKLNADGTNEVLPAKEGGTSAGLAPVSVNADEMPPLPDFLRRRKATA